MRVKGSTEIKEYMQQMIDNRHDMRILYGLYVQNRDQVTYYTAMLDKINGKGTIFDRLLFFRKARYEKRLSFLLAQEKEIAKEYSVRTLFDERIRQAIEQLATEEGITLSECWVDELLNQGVGPDQFEPSQAHDSKPDGFNMSSNDGRDVVDFNTEFDAPGEGGVIFGDADPSAVLDLFIFEFLGDLTNCGFSIGFMGHLPFIKVVIFLFTLYKFISKLIVFIFSKVKPR